MKLINDNKIEINEKELKFLKQLKYTLNSQDNRCTSYPIWRVFEQKLIFGVDYDVADGVCIVNTDTDEVFFELDGLIDEILSYLTDENGDPYTSIEWFLNDIGECIDINSLGVCHDFLVNILDWDNYIYTPYLEIPVFVDQFLTQKEADVYVCNNKHKFNNKLVIKVESCWNNAQLVSLIDIIKKM